MTAPFQFKADESKVEILQAGGQPLLTYVYVPSTPLTEARRPYLHPVYSLDGDILTALRPNDHPWHHGLSLTLTRVNDVNFWGGPSFAAADGYQWRDDHGEQVHVRWVRQEPDALEHIVEWRGGPERHALIRERRLLAIRLQADGWSLDWRSDLLNVSGGELLCHNYHSLGGLAGSHYSGLQFRGARGLLDEHGDAAIGVLADGGLMEPAPPGGVRWVEWHTQHDTTLRRTRLRFESGGTAVNWFLRPALPLLCFSPHLNEPLKVAPDQSLRLEHRITFGRLPT